MRAVSVEHGAEARPEWCLRWNWGKGSPGEDGKDCIRSPGSQQNHLEIFNSQLERVRATWSDCEVSPALSRLYWTPLEIPSSLYHSTGHHINCLTLGGEAEVGATTTVVLWCFVRWERLQLWEFCRLGSICYAEWMLILHIGIIMTFILRLKMSFIWCFKKKCLIQWYRVWLAGLGFFHLLRAQGVSFFLGNVRIILYVNNCVFFFGLCSLYDLCECEFRAKSKPYDGSPPSS